MLNLVKELSLSITGPADIPNIHLLISEIRPIWDLSSVQIKVFNEGTSNTLFAVYTGLDLSPENCLLTESMRLFIFGFYINLDLPAKYLPSSLMAYVMNIFRASCQVMSLLSSQIITS
uniref:Uncharacterized protein n=1 Tax=Schistocephalus solidus TaxID=70667 RepID=A0A0X3PBP7_SCHSO